MHGEELGESLSENPALRFLLFQASSITPEMVCKENLVFSKS